MEEVFIDIIKDVISNFDFTYIIIVNILTYLIIKIIDKYNKRKKVTTWNKRVVLLISIFIVILIYYITGDINWRIIINSSIITPVFWSWILKPICIKFKINYKAYDK